MLDEFLQSFLTNLEQFVDSLFAWLGLHLPSIVGIIVIALVLRRFLPRILSRLLHRTIPRNLYPTKADRDKRLRTIDSMVTAIVHLGIFVAAAFLIVAEINPGYTAALLASAGIATVAIGFGAQSLIKDFTTGIFIISENQYRVGDTVVIAGVSGVVEDVTVRTTLVRDIDGNIHFVPNGLIEVATNKTMGFNRINEEFVVPADTDMDTLGELVVKVGKELANLPEFEKKITQPPTLGNLKGYAPNGGIIITIVGKTTAGDKWRVRSELYRLLSRELEKKGIHATSLAAVPTAPPKK